MDVETVTALASPAGAALVRDAAQRSAQARARAAAGAPDALDPLRAASALRAAHPDADPALLAAALTQVALRDRGRSRLGDDVEVVLLTEDGLEQATRPQVARERARRYRDAGATHVADLGCGLGLDAVAFARAGLRVTAVERDPATAALASHNLDALGLADRVRVLEGDVTDVDLLDAVVRDVDAAFVDPARRDPGRRREGRSARVIDPSSWSPPWPWVARLAERVPRTAAKVAPGIDHALIPAQGTGTWTSVDGQLVECEIAWPALAGGDVRRRAVVLRRGTVAALGDPGDLADEPAPPVAPVGRWLLEPDDAVVRAGLVAGVARSVQGWLLDPLVAYVSTDVDVDLAPLAARYAVEHVLAYDLGRLRAALVADGVGDVVVKKRAVGLDPALVRRDLRLPTAPGRATVVLTRVGDERLAIVCRRQQPPTSIPHLPTGE